MYDFLQMYILFSNLKLDKYQFKSSNLNLLIILQKKKRNGQDKYSADFQQAQKIYYITKLINTKNISALELYRKFLILFYVVSQLLVDQKGQLDFIFIFYFWSLSIIKRFMEDTKNLLISLLVVLCLIEPLSSALVSADGNCLLVGECPAQTLDRAQYEVDQNFTSIDSKLRNSYNLAGLVVNSVTKQFINGYLYSITYKDLIDQTTYVFKVFISSAGQSQVQVVPNTITSRYWFATPYSTQAAKYLTDPNFRKINQKLRNQNNLTRAIMQQVAKQSLTNENRFIILYKTPGSIFFFNVSINNEGKIEVKANQTYYSEKNAFDTEAYTMSKEQYSKDQDFLQVDTKLRKQYHLSGFSPLEVIKTVVGKTTSFTIVYDNEIEEIFYFRVMSPTTSSAELLVMEVSSNPSITIQSSPLTLSRLQYLRDKKFLQIDDKLRSKYDLKGFNLNEVSRQFVNGYNYSITYSKGKFNFSFKVYISPQGSIQVKSQKLTSGQPSLGAPQTLAQAQYSVDKDFLQVDAYLKKSKNWTTPGFSPVQVSKQLVSGYVFDVAYTNALGDIYIFKVYKNLKNEIQIQSQLESHLLTPVWYLNYAADIKDTVEFSACLYGVLQSDSRLKSAKIVDAKMQIGQFVFKYTLLLSTSSGNYESVSAYEYHLKKTYILPIVPKAAIATLHY